MSNILILAFVFAGLIVLLALIAALQAKLSPRKGASTQKSYPYIAQANLFTANERSFMAVLEKVVNERYKVLGKVRLADVLKVKPGLSRSENQAAFNSIRSKHLDYVLCKPGTMEIAFCIELDDRSHQSRKGRDDFVNNAMQASGIPLVRVKATGSYRADDVRKSLDSYIYG
jgi:hypothetical protein